MIKEYLKSIAKLIIWYIVLQFIIKLFDRLFYYEFVHFASNIMLLLLKFTFIYNASYLTVNMIIKQFKN